MSFNCGLRNAKISALVISNEKHQYQPVPLPQGTFVGLAPWTKLQISLNCKMKQYKTVKFL